MRNFTDFFGHSVQILKDYVNSTKIDFPNLRLYTDQPITASTQVDITFNTFLTSDNEKSTCMLILGIESSCDDTAAAVLRDTVITSYSIHYTKLYEMLLLHPS